MMLGGGVVVCAISTIFSPSIFEVLLGADYAAGARIFALLI